MTLSTSALVNAPIDAVWRVQSPWDQMTVWYQSFDALRITTADKGAGQIGSRRECSLRGTAGKKVIREELVHWDPVQYEYSYSMLPYTDASENPMPVQLVDHRADVSLRPVTHGTNAGQTYVRWSIRFNVTDGGQRVARLAVFGIFKALFADLQAYFSKNPAAASKAAAGTPHVAGKQAWQSIVLDDATRDEAWAALVSGDLQTHEPAFIVRPLASVRSIDDAFSSRGDPTALFGVRYTQPSPYQNELIDASFEARVAKILERDGRDLRGKGAQRLVWSIGTDMDSTNTTLLFAADDVESGVVGELASHFGALAGGVSAELRARRKHGATNPCCSMPCSSRGTCVPIDATHFKCDCGNTGYTGERCTVPTLSTLFAVSPLAVNAWIDMLMTSMCGWPAPFGWVCVPSFDREQIARNSRVLAPLMWFVSAFDVLLRPLMRAAVSLKVLDPLVAPAPYTTVHSYKAFEGMVNRTFYGRLLAAVPDECPTPAGIAGARQLWPAERVVDTFLRRRQFKPSSLHISVLLPMYAQHFTHQFFKTSNAHPYGGLTDHLDHYLDMNQVYGRDVAITDLLREHRGGRMLMKLVNGEWLPPTLSDINGTMPSDIPPSVLERTPPNERFALGHPFFAIFPGLTALSAIWLREHNRIAALLAAEHPTWGDERLFQTARMIVNVVCMQVTVNDYVGENLAHGNLKFKFFPDAMHWSGIQHQNRIAIEFNHLYHWHALLPDVYNVSGRIYSESELIFRNKIILDHGVGAVLDSMSRQLAGEANGANFGRTAQFVAKRVINYGRSMRIQSLNAYRKSAGQLPYKSFEEMTDDASVVAALREAYGHVDAVEMFVGMFAEKRRENGLFGPTITARGVASTFQGVWGHPLLSEENFRESTFGGGVGWKIVNEPCSLEQLIQRNSPKLKNGRAPRGQMNVRDLEAREVWIQTEL
jgi:hypothetical protein